MGKVSKTVSETFETTKKCSNDLDCVSVSVSLCLYERLLSSSLISFQMESVPIHSL